MGVEGVLAGERLRGVGGPADYGAAGEVLVNV